MSCTLLVQLAELQTKALQQEARKSSSKTLALPPSCVSQSFADDLESLFYVFIYICIKYGGPNSKEHQESIHDSLPDSWSTLDLDECKLRKVYFFAVSSKEAHLAKQFHPYFAPLIPLAKEWRAATLRDNMETRVTFDSVINLLEHHLTTLQDDEERASTTEDLKKSAEELARCMNKRTAEAGSSSISMPQLAKRKKHDSETADWESDLDGSVTEAMVASNDSHQVYGLD
ncbi:uncharacterized protein HD556DRAFT_1440759 [Suillus plorans]|uniref:Fungal-type protein kinase domain-containing protein n=1 Tax=Suillus plorans TaxID=116603 RepID=A0A9P7DLG7_9AGAM|nr:uncharacterized protein HD556DRAFT_1440759 [Suillus plorans]KAG1797798.1 hypothetical protein HD556DRAFT_1440759 [Suillus plorans]